jgi:type II secretory pathway component GspD/PulD (secretin)
MLLYGSIAIAQTAPTTTNPPVPLQLKPASNAPITLHMVDDSKTVYQAIGKAAGINVIFDADYVSKRIPVDLTNVSLSDALRIVGDLSDTFYKPVTSDTILIALNSITKHRDLDERTIQTFYLHNVSQPTEANEIYTALRNMLSAEVKSYLIPDQNTILVNGTAEQNALAQSLINNLDRPKSSYRLTYTVTEMNGDKLVAKQHFDFDAVSGQTETLKQGSKVPVATGTYNSVASDTKPAGAQTQFSYLDIGMNIDQTVEAMNDSAMLKLSIERSSLSPTASGVGPQDPIVLFSSLRGTYLLKPDKSQSLGSMAISGSTNHLEIEVVMKPLP